jgi:hypothetical protein
VAFLAPLTAFLHHCHPTADPHDLETAATEALVTYLRTPQRFDPSQCSLPGYLRMLARADLKNLWRSAQRHEHVELPVEMGNNSQPALLDVLIAQEETGSLRTQVDALAQRLSPSDQKVLQLLLEGERETAVFARELNLGHLPVAEQRREVKRAKDRIQRRLDRGVDHV